MTIRKEELFNSNISEMASVNRMYFLCYMIGGLYMDLAGIDLFWHVGISWSIYDPLFFYMLTLIPVLIGYWLYKSKKDSVYFKQYINLFVLIFYIYGILTGKDFFFSFFILPMLIASIAYANVKYTLRLSVGAMAIDALGMVYIRFVLKNYESFRMYLAAFMVILVSVTFMNICCRMIAKRQARRFEEINRERDRFRAIVSVGAHTIFEYDIKDDLCMASDCTSGEYGEERYIANFKSVVKKQRLIAFADWYRFDELVHEVKAGITLIEKEMRISNDGNSYRWYRVKARVIRNEEKSLEKVIGSLEDIDDEKLYEIRKADEKMRDPITHYYLSDFFGEKVNSFFKDKDDEKLAGFFLIDVDDFDRLVDDKGISFGDEILKNIASDISKLFYETDMFGRIGESEFVVLMKDVEDKHDIERKVKEIQKVIADTYIGEGELARCSVSMGVSVYPDDGTDYYALLYNAQKALTLACSKGRNHYDIYNPIKENVYTTLSTELMIQDVKRQNEIGDRSRSAETFAELAFRLIDESKDTDSAINLLIRQVARQMCLDAVVIKEKSTQCTMKVLYQCGMDEDSVYSNNSAIEFTTVQWNKMLDAYKYYGGIRVVENLQEVEGDDVLFFMLAMGIESYVSCAYYDKSEFVGSIDFIDYNDERYWSEADVNTFRTLTDIVSLYLLKMKAFERATETVERLTEYDDVTGLYKYEKFFSIISEYIQSAEHGNYAILYMDICNFKYLNEVYGYEKGDDILREVAEYIRSIKGIICTSRVFSDNIIALYKVGDIDEATLRKKLDKRLKAISLKIQGIIVNGRFDMRIGVCPFTISGGPVPIKVIISNANMARKRAKLPGMPRCIFYDEQMGTEAKNEIKYTNDMEAALQNHEFVVYMQPQICLQTGRIRAAEALIRWKKDDGNIIYPNDFIPVFEKNNSITTLDFYVYEEVAKYLRYRLDNNLSVIPISVNVSRIHLYRIDEIIEKVKGILATYAIPPNLMEFELTETAFIDKVEDTITLMKRLKKLGVKVSLDDFGSGYSSLNVLTKLPLDVLKLDKGFMKDFDSDSDEKVVVPCIIEMAKKLNLTVVCEGVETKEQFDFLKSVNCDIAQGYFYSRPITKEQFSEMLDEDSK